MKKIDNIRLYAWLEFIIWLIIISLCVFGIRYHNYNIQKQFKSYQIFMDDIDGLIVGSPVRFLGVQIGHITKIQFVNSDIYIKFIITKKNLELPIGAVATVEGSGLGGSKALEIYPPEDKNSDKIIAVKSSTRLSKVMGLFQEIFKDFDQIFAAFGYASKKLDLENEIPKNVVMPDTLNQGFIRIDNAVKTIKNTNEIKSKPKEIVSDTDNLKKEGEDEHEQRESDN